TRADGTWSGSRTLLPRAWQVPDDSGGQCRGDADRGNRQLPPPPSPAGLAVPAGTEDVAHCHHHRAASVLGTKIATAGHAPRKRQSAVIVVLPFAQGSAAPLEAGRSVVVGRGNGPWRRDRAGAGGVAGQRARIDVEQRLGQRRRRQER